METNTYFYEAKRENSAFRMKLDIYGDEHTLFKGFQVIFWDRVFKFNIPDDGTPPDLDVRKPTEDELDVIRKDGFSNVGKLWSDEEIEDLKQLFVSEDGDLVKISKKVERTQQGIRLRLKSMGLIDEKDQKIEVSTKPETPKKKPKTKYGQFTQSEEDELRFLFTETKGDVKKISEGMNRTEKSIRMKLWFLDLIGEEDVNWLDKLQRKDYPNETKKK